MAASACRSASGRLCAGFRIPTGSENASEIALFGDGGHPFFGAARCGSAIAEFYAFNTSEKSLGLPAPPTLGVWSSVWKRGYREKTW
jgi:hypothetical protein